MALPVFGKAHEARPADGFLWFVYGSSLDRDTFSVWAREHGYALPDLDAARPARLPGYRLSFDVVSRHWGGAVATLVESLGDVVEGVVLELPGTSRRLVDHKEGALSGLYEAIAVKVATATGEVDAVAYRALPSRRLAAEGPPSPAFLDAVVRGARAAGLSAAWIARLEALRGDGAAPHPR
jgi:gamma-glutamylcyclotransferase